MKKFIYILFIAGLLMNCSTDSDSSSTSESAIDQGQGGSLAKFAISGDYLYVVDEFDLNVFNISTPSDPVQVNRAQIGFGIETIFSFRNYLYIGSRNGMFIYSVENPEFPERLSSVEHFTACDPVVANENYAFVTLWTDTGCGNNINQLEVYDVTDVLNPTLVSTRNLTFPKGLGLYGDYLFVCDDEIKVIDVSDPANSVLVHSINRLAFDIIIQGDLLIAVGEQGVYQYQLDSTNIENTEILSTINI